MKPDWRPRDDMLTGSDTKNVPVIDVKPESNQNGNLEDKHVTSTAAVMTRAQSAKEKRPIKPLKVPEVTGSEITSEQLKKLQKEDSTLTKYFGYAIDKKLFQIRAGFRYTFDVKKGILFKMVS